MVESLANLTSNTLIFDKWRLLLGYIGERLKFYSDDGTNILGYLGECHLCTSHQISLILPLFYSNLNYFPTTYLIINYLILSLIIGRGSYILHLFVDQLESIKINSNTTNLTILEKTASDPIEDNLPL